MKAYWRRYMKASIQKLIMTPGIPSIQTTWRVSNLVRENKNKLCKIVESKEVIGKKTIPSTSISRLYAGWKWLAQTFAALYIYYKYVPCTENLMEFGWFFLSIDSKFKNFLRVSLRFNQSRKPSKSVRLTTIL